MSGFDTKTYRMLLDGGRDREIVIDQHCQRSDFFIKNINLEISKANIKKVNKLVIEYFGIKFKTPELRALLKLYPRVLILSETSPGSKEAIESTLDMIMHFFLSCEFPCVGHQLLESEINGLIEFTRHQAKKMGFKITEEFKESHYY